MSRWSGVWRPLAVAVVAVGAGLAVGSSASARTVFDFSVPTDGATIGEVLTEVTVGFTDPVTLVGPGFEVSDPQGEVSQPFVVTDDDTVFRLQIDPPISGGQVGVRYEVKADDGHVISGGFSFAVSAPAPGSVPTTSVSSTLPTVPSTADPAVSAVATTITTAVATTIATTAADDEAQETVATATVTPAGSATTAPTGPSGSSDGGGGGHTTAYLVVAAAVGIGAGGFLLFRRSP